MRQVCSGTRLAFSAPDSSVNELPVVHNTKDLDDVVWIDPIEHQMARISDAMLSDHQVPCGPEMQRSDVLDARNAPRAGHGGSVPDGFDRGEYQPIVASCRFNAPALRAFKYDLVDPALCASSEAPGH